MKKFLVIMCAALFLAGCQSDQDEPQVTQNEEAETRAVSERVVRQRSAAGEEAAPATAARPGGDLERQIPRLEGQFTEPGMGLANIVDGTSPEAFVDSLALIAAETSQEQYAELDSALRYLRMYSSAAWSGLPDLYQSLDSMTGEEIIAHAIRLQEERNRR